MVERDKKKFAELLNAVGQMCGQTITPPQLRLYWGVLVNEYETIQDFEKVVIKLLNSWNYSYMPKPAHFLEQTKTSIDEVSLIANESWSDVIEAIRDGGGYTKTVTFECPLTEYAVNSVGGLSKLCEKTSDELDWVKKDFVKIFISAYKTERIGKIENTKTNLLENTKTKLVSSRFTKEANKNEEIDTFFIKKLSQKVSDARITIKNAMSKGVAYPFRALTLKDTKERFFTDKELRALASLGTATYINRLCEDNRLEDELLKLFVYRSLGMQGKAELPNNAQKVMKMLGAKKF